MNKEPLVSVIMIFYNAEKFIEEAIESVLSQTYKNWELLLVDDGSTDDSTQIALGYVKKYPEKLVYLQHENHENRGMSSSRNLGIRNSKGEYITFLDADDVWYPYTLDEQIEIFSKYPEAGMVYGCMLKWYSWSGLDHDKKLDSISPKLNKFLEPNNVFDPPTLLSHFLNSRYVYPGMCSIIVKKDVLEKLGGFVHYFPGHFEDQVIKSKIFLSEKVYVTDSIWSKYRQHPESCTSIDEKKGFKPLYRLFFYYWLDMYLSERNLRDSELWIGLQNKIKWTMKKIASENVNHIKQIEKLNKINFNNNRKINKLNDEIESRNKKIIKLQDHIEAIKNKRNNKL